MIDAQARLGRNTFWMILSRFGAQGLAVAFTILLARRLGTAGFGVYALIVTIVFVANALTTFGTDMLLIREIAAKRDYSRLPSALIVQLALSVLFIAAVWMVGRRIPNQSPETVTALKIYFLTLIPLAFFTIFTTALRGAQRMEIYSLLNLVVSVLQVCIALLPNINIVGLSALLLSVQIIAAVFAGFVCAVTLPDFRVAWNFSSLRLFPLLKQASPIAWLTVLGMIYQRLNIYMLSTMNGAMETGIYSAAARAVEASKTSHLAVFAALYPAMAEGALLRVSGRKSPTLYFGYLLIGAILISFSLFILAKPLVLLLYGIEFASSAGVLQILAWTLIPFTVNTYLTLSFLATNRERLIRRALTVSLLGLLILNLWWIPAKGPEGGAWSALVAECIQAAFLLAGAGWRVHLQGDVHELSELS